MASIPFKQRFVTRKTLHEGWTYVSVPDDNIVIGIRTAVTKVMKLFNEDGAPVKDNTGSPAYSFQSTNIVRVLTNEEFNVIKKTSLNE